ncbi:hypothetical protein [Flammeovirga aprica]|uniref:Lipoprotein n=1 Tax=Flammeovirga aprica JL-4 TaxID=694437 RepID=A0A7X9RXE9_9BACT|nr:hypothetical protein [Flammeovirga aprica]NME70448.1 hypothetical protein [Flammeovirga aprica JL-4]
MQKLIGLFLLLLTSCVYSEKQKDGYYHYSYCTAVAGEESEYHLYKTSFENEVDSSNLKIKILDKLSQGYLNFPVYIDYSSIDGSSGRITVLDSLTKYFKPDTYDLKVRSIGCSDLNIDSLLIEKENTFELRIEMGFGSGFADFDIQSKRRLTKFQIRRKGRKFAK